MRKDRKHRTGNRVLRGLIPLLICFVLVGGITHPGVGQEDSEDEVNTVASLEDLPPVADTTQQHWYEITAGESNHWIGWAMFERQELNPVDLEQDAPIHRYHWEGEVSLRVVQEQLQREVREELVSEEDDFRMGEEFRRQVQSRTQERLDEIRDVLDYRSFSSTIYLHDDGTFRAARFAVSGDENFTIYLKPNPEQLNQLLMFRMGYTEQTLTFNPDLLLANTPLAAERIFGDGSFSPRSREMQLLEGTLSEPIQTLQAIVQPEETELESGDETIQTRAVVVGPASDEGMSQRQTWYIDNNGVLQRLTRHPGEEGTRLQMNRTNQQRARRGIEFVFSRQGRRNPFRPLFERREPENMEEDEEETREGCEDYDGEAALSRAEDLVYQVRDLQEGIEEQDRLIEEQIRILDEFSSIRSRVQHCGTSDEKEQIDEWNNELQERIDVGSLVLDVIGSRVTQGKEALENLNLQRLNQLKSEVDRWVDEMPENLDAETTEEIQQKQSQMDRLVERGEVRREFLNNQPDIRGVILSEEQNVRDLTVEVDLFGETFPANFQIAVPDSRSVVILETTQGQRAHVPGDVVELPQLSEVTVRWVQEDGVIFSYQGESIKVPVYPEEENTDGGEEDS